MCEDLTYITPRLVLIHNLQLSTSTLKDTHGNYFYLFNLSKQDHLIQTLFPKINVKIKNRGFPFSLKVVLQLCMQLERYFYKGVCNTAAFYCPENELAACAIICYMYTTGRFKQMKDVIQYFMNKQTMELPIRWLLNFEEFFDNMNIVMPAVKILKRVVLKSQPEIVPVFEVFREGRFQQLESVYEHPILEDLEEYQHHAMRAHHHTKKPQATYVFKPVVLAGDFKLDLYSYKELKYQKIASIGFNTIFIDTDTIVFQNSDIYNSSLPSNSRIILEFDDYCECTSENLYSTRCYHCIEELKNIKKEYNQLIDLSCQFNRNRKKDIATQLVFGNQKFDDSKQ